MKKILSILALVSALALSACNSATQESPEQLSIQAVYSIDSKITASSKSASEVVSKMQSVRLAGCPVDFTNAYKDYIRAWDKLVSLEKKMYGHNMKKASSDLSSYISDFNSASAVVALKKEWPAFASEIDSTTEAITKAYANCISVGARYNAVVKKDLF